MSGLRLGELCAGYGGLGMAVEEVFGAETAWFSEFDAAPSKILAHHWPHVPNYGDMTKIDWAAIEPVDIISGGTPCQDLSAAGRRAGMTEGTRSNLWVQMREAIAIQKPTYVVWENVRGAYSATAASDLEQCPGCMGNAGDGGTVLRALGRVLGDLSDLGYDTQWRGLRAADVGAPHGRSRVFVLALRRDALADSVRGGSRGRPAVAGHGYGTRADAPTNGPDDRLDQPGATRSPGVGSPAYAGGFRGNQAIEHDGSGAPAHDGPGVPNQPDSDALRSGPKRGHDGKSRGANGRFAPLTHTDSRNDAGREQDQERGPVRRASTQRSGGNVHATTESASFRGREGRPEHARVQGGSHAIECGSSTDWGQYTPAIRRWEALRGTAPSPTELTAKGTHRLSARFAEWMMGLPDGWVTDPTIGISRNDQLKACGNGVVPQQAMAALRDMLAAFQAVEVAV